MVLISWYYESFVPVTRLCFSIHRVKMQSKWNKFFDCGSSLTKFYVSKKIFIFYITKINDLFKLQEYFITGLDFATVKNHGEIFSEDLIIVCHSSIIFLPKIIKKFCFLLALGNTSTKTFFLVKRYFHKILKYYINLFEL